MPATKGLPVGRVCGSDVSSSRVGILYPDRLLHKVRTGDVGAW